MKTLDRNSNCSVSDTDSDTVLSVCVSQCVWVTGDGVCLSLTVTVSDSDCVSACSV